MTWSRAAIEASIAARRLRAKGSAKERAKGLLRLYGEIEASHSNARFNASQKVRDLPKVGDMVRARSAPYAEMIHGKRIGGIKRMGVVTAAQSKGAAMRSIAVKWGSSKTIQSMYAGNVRVVKRK